MKPVTIFILTFILVFVLAGCTRSGETKRSTQIRQSLSPTVIPPTSTRISTPTPTIAPTKTIIPPTYTRISTIAPTITPTKTIIPPTLTLIPSVTPTLTPTPFDTLEPAKADEVILGLLRDPGDCMAPCFWGIVPGKTTPYEANRFFFHLGFSTYNPLEDGTNFTHYEVVSHFSIGVEIGSQNNIVEKQRIVMQVIGSNGITESSWMAYSPKALIQRYGKPSSVEFYWNLQGGNLSFTIVLYFDDYDLIVLFHSPDLPDSSSPKVCPLAARYDYVWIWMGKNFDFPPEKGFPLDKVTSLTIDEFVTLMTGDSDHSCFTLNISPNAPH
jgi:hypothetical protein